MPTGRDYTKHQRGIINRYYLHHGTIVLGRLQELVGELYLASGAEADKLWTRAEKALAAAKCEPPLPDARVQKILDDRDVEGLAKLITEIDARA
ncbi:MAG: hypothetical protein AAGI17_05095 [Planctomycetota bacterium]